MGGDKVFKKEPASLLHFKSFCATLITETETGRTCSEISPGLERVKSPALSLRELN